MPNDSRGTRRQASLFGDDSYPQRPGYVAGSDTSEGAAGSFDSAVLQRLRGMVFALVKQRARFGATCDEVEIELQLRHQTASARLRELVLAGAIEDTGRRRDTRSHRKARVYCTIESRP